MVVLSDRAERPRQRPFCSGSFSLLSPVHPVCSTRIPLVPNVEDTTDRHRFIPPSSCASPPAPNDEYTTYRFRFIGTPASYSVFPPPCMTKTRRIDAVLSAPPRLFTQIRTTETWTTSLPCPSLFRRTRVRISPLFYPSPPSFVEAPSDRAEWPR